MKKLINYFLKGLLIFAPMALTVFVLVWIFGILENMFGENFPTHIKSLNTIIGLIITLAFICLLGFLASTYFGAKIVSLTEKIFKKAPLIKLLYNAIKDFTEAFASDKKKFDKPVLVTIIPDSNAKVMGFITRESLDVFNLTGQVAVYLPQSYNFAGSLLILPSEQVERLDIESSEAMTFIVSGGVSGPT